MCYGASGETKIESYTTSHCSLENETTIIMTVTGSIGSGGGGGGGDCGDGDIERGASANINHPSTLPSAGGEPSCRAVDSTTTLTSTTGVDEESGGERSVSSNGITLMSNDCEVPPGREARSEGENHYTISTPIFLQDANLDKTTLSLFPAENDSNVSVSQEKIELTVIDGPLAGLGGGKTDKPCAVVGGIVAYHTPTSSLGSSLGEIMGEAPSLAVHDNDSPTVVDGSSTTNKSMTQDQQLSVEGDNASSPDIITDVEFMATSATPVRRKPILKHSIPSHFSSAATSASDPPPVRSPQPTKSSRNQPNSSHDNADDHPIDNRDADIKGDDDDDGENDIPAHIKSKIVEKSPAERYIRFNEKLGSGAYKDVYRAYDTIEGIEVAWNVVKLSGVPKAERIRIVNEVRLLERLHHPNIISFHGSWVNRETERVIFVTEILSSGTLKSFVQKVQLIRWKIFKRWAIQILNGLAYLHSQDPPIIHRDLKCDNIFINGTSGDLRIGDFGLSTAINQRNQVRWYCCR